MVCIRHRHRITVVDIDFYKKYKSYR